MTKVKKKRLGFSKNSKPSKKEGGAGKEEAENDVRVPLHVMFYVQCWLVIQLMI